MYFYVHASCRLTFPSFATPKKKKKHCKLNQPLQVSVKWGKFRTSLFAKQKNVNTITYTTIISPFSSIHLGWTPAVNVQNYTVFSHFPPSKKFTRMSFFISCFLNLWCFVFSWIIFHVSFRPVWTTFHPDWCTHGQFGALSQAHPTNDYSLFDLFCFSPTN